MNTRSPVDSFQLRPVGVIISTLVNIEDCPLQESEGGPEAFLQLHEPYERGGKDFKAGDKLILLTWLHLADREVLQCHSRRFVGTKEFGVFSTRSPDRPNPIGLHTVTVIELISPQKFRVFPLEALNGTPVIDIKPVI